jgi:hypothetical protein
MRGSLFLEGVGSCGAAEGQDVAWGYESEKLRYTKPATQKLYTPDFVLRSGARVIYVEAKGYFPSADRTKMLAVKASNPDLDIRLLFQRATNTLRKTSTTSYAAWAERHGFPWAEGMIPRAWLDALLTSNSENREEKRE